MVLVLLVAAIALVAVLVAAPERLAQVRVRALRLLAAAAAVQLATAALMPGSGTARWLAFVLTWALVGLFVVGNRDLPGAPLIGLGLLLNVVVVAANGAMPVSVTAARRLGISETDLDLPGDPVRERLGDSSTLGWLGDVLPVALPWWPQVVSPGDAVVAAGVGLLLVAGGDQRPTRASRSTVLPSESTTTGSYS